MSSVQTSTLLEARGVSKRFGAVVALQAANLSVAPGEVHALLGANGAGKSTLVKILTGVHRADEGTFVVEGETVKVGSPSSATRLGLASVFQDPALVPDLTIGQNLRLTGVSVDAVRERLHEMGLRADMGALAGDVPLPMLRMIDLARALARSPKLLILDEITAALPADLADVVFRVMDEQRASGRSVLFITHRLREVIATCDRATVLRDGTDVATLVPQEGGEEAIVEQMLGGEAFAAATVEAPVGERSQAADRVATLEVRDLQVGAVSGVSFTLRAGEVLGLAALEGQGQDELFAALSGDRKPDAGEIVVGGKRLRARNPYDSIRQGVVLVPADRLLALLPQRSVAENISSPRFNTPLRWGPIHMGRDRARVRGAVEELQIDIRAMKQVRRLSGGNQQKVTIARWLANGFGTLLCYDPTRGIDVGTKRQIYGLMRRLADDGAAILYYSSELGELPQVADRILTLYNGQVTAELAATEADEAALLHAMHGLTREEASA